MQSKRKCQSDSFRGVLYTALVHCLLQPDLLLSNSFSANFRACKEEKHGLIFLLKSVALPFCQRQGQFLIGHVQLVSLIPIACSGQWLLFLLTPRFCAAVAVRSSAQRNTQPPPICTPDRDKSALLFSADTFLLCTMF